MNTNTTEAFKIPTLKVDNLRHIHDHGLAVEFTDPKLVALVNHLKRDGYTRLDAGQSHLCIRTVGRVTFTKVYFAHGSYTHHAAHYLDPQSGLKFKLEDSEDSQAFATLKAVILGRSMPSEFDCAFGQQQDALRVWLKKYAWTLSGEAGMRAKAAEKQLDGLHSLARGAEGQAEYEQRQLSVFDKRNFQDEIESAFLNMKTLISNSQKREENIRGWLLEIEKPEPEYPSFINLGMTTIYHRTEDGRYQHIPTFRGTPPTSSHPILRPNYTVTRDGDVLTLSSGIKCNVSAAEALAWLRGEAGPPSTQYGSCRLEEAATDDGKAWKAVRCGCHILDLRPLGDDFAQVLVPTHVVTIVPGLPELRWDKDPDACRVRMREMAEGMIQREVSSRESDMAAFLQRKKEITHDRDNKEQVLEAMRAKIEALKEESRKRQSEVDVFLSTVGTGTIETLQANLITACNALAGIRISTK